MWSAVSGCTWCPHFPAQTVPVGTNSSHVTGDVVNVSDILRTSLLSKLTDQRPLSCVLSRCCPDSVSHLSRGVQLCSSLWTDLPCCHSDSRGGASRGLFSGGLWFALVSWLHWCHFLTLSTVSQPRVGWGVSKKERNWLVGPGFTYTSAFTFFFSLYSSHYSSHFILGQTCPSRDTQ